MFAKELSLVLEINTNTLRRWSLELEGQGYEFSRNDQNQRIYHEHDISVIHDFRKTLEKTQSIENSAKAAVSRVNERKKAEKKRNIIGDSKGKIVFSNEELDSLINRLTDEAFERAAEHFSQKFLDLIEQGDSKMFNEQKENVNCCDERERKVMFFFSSF